MEFKKFSAGLYSYGLTECKKLFYIIYCVLMIGDNKEAMRYNTEGEEEEISNVNFDDPTFYSHFRDKGSVNYD